MSFTAAIVGFGPRGLDHAVALGAVDGVSVAAHVIEFIRGLSFGRLLDQGPHLIDARSRSTRAGSRATNGGQD